MQEKSKKAIQNTYINRWKIDNWYKKWWKHMEEIRKNTNIINEKIKKDIDNK